jgi:membrane protein YdbS with pleckstrin-like domain
VATETPINLRLNSFASFDDAMDMCDLLNRETGDKYTVMPDNHLGFTARRCQENQFNQELKKVEAFEEDTEYRQSLWGFTQHYSEFVIGVLLTISPYKFLGWAFALLSIQEIPEWFSVTGWGEAMRFAGLLLFLWSLRFIYSYYAVKLCFDDDGVVLKKGIIALNQVQIRYGDIKTIGVQQSILDRLLGIGTLHLDSAGTNGTVDIIFDNLVNPVDMRHRIQSLIDQYMKQRG